MKTYEHIVKLEDIRKEHEEKIKQLNDILTYLNDHMDEYKQLVEYYYNSDQRKQDLIDEEMQLIPKNIHRGVLSEDEVYDLSCDYYNSGIRMIEIAIQMMKIH